MLAAAKPSKPRFPARQHRNQRPIVCGTWSAIEMGGGLCPPPICLSDYRTSARYRGRSPCAGVTVVDPRHRRTDSTHLTGRDRDHPPLCRSREADQLCGAGPTGAAECRHGPARRFDRTRLGMAAYRSGGVGSDRRPNQFHKIFRRVSFRRGRNVGIIAAARRLVEVIWHVWSKDVLYQEPASPGKESGSHAIPAATASASPAA